MINLDILHANSWFLPPSPSPFILTVISTAVVRKGIVSKINESELGFIESLKEGFKAITDRKGVLYLVLVSSVMTTFMGAVQILSEPLILSFNDSATLGILETACASGMLVTSIILGIKGIKRGYVKILSLSLGLAGVAMVVFGLYENVLVIGVAGFAFFAMLLTVLAVVFVIPVLIDYANKLTEWEERNSQRMDSIEFNK